MYLFNHYRTVENKYLFLFESVFAPSGLWGYQRAVVRKMRAHVAVSVTPNSSQHTLQINGSVGPDTGVVSVGFLSL